MAVKPAPRIAKSKRRIFVVEDHPAVFEGLGRLINAQRDLMVCGKADGGAKACKDIRRLRPDLAVIDLGLSEKSGPNLIKQVRSLKIPVKLLVVSRHVQAIHAQRALRAGGDGYILKQEDPAEIINAMRDVLNGRLYVSEAVLASGRSPSLSAGKDRSLKHLTDFELEILESLGEGKSNEEMARQFRMTAGEVNDRCLQIQHTLKLKSINALIRYAVCRLEKIEN